MKVARKRPGEPWEFAEIDNTLETLQAEVGGSIETLTVCSDACLVCLVMNEEGRLLNLPFNFRWGTYRFYGTVLLVGVKGDEFGDVPLTKLSILPK